MKLGGRDRSVAVSPPRRPAVVEHVGSPQSTSDGRATSPLSSGAMGQKLLQASGQARFAGMRSGLDDCTGAAPTGA